METGPKKKKLSANGKRVYHDLQEAGGDCGTEEQFYDFLNAPREQGYKNRRKVYEDLKKSGGDPGTYEQFAQWLGVHPIKPSAPVAAAQKPAAAQTAHPQQTAQAAAPVQRAPAAKPKPRNGRLTAAQRQAYIARAQQMSQQVGASVQRTKNRMDYARATSGLRTPRVQLGSKAGGGAKLGENSRVVATQPKFNPATGKMERVYLTELGNEYTSRAEADMEQNEIDEAVQQQLYPGYNDYNDKQAVAAQAPATAVAAQLWKEAQKAYDAERNANAKEVYGGNPWLRGGREMHVVDGATNSGKNEESRLKHFDLQKMSDNAWARVGKQMTASCYARLRKMYPNALERQVQASAEKEARALVQNAVYKYAVKMNAPKSQLDFFLRKAVDANLLTSVFRGLARYGAGTTGDMAAYEAANEEYGKSHRWTGVFGTATGMAFDPTNWVGVYVGSLGGRAALNIGGRFVLGSAPGVGARLFGSTMAGRLATGAASGMGMMGTYEGVKEAERQWVYGGHVNPETRENEGYSAGAVALSALKGAGLGAMTGMVSPLVGNVADKVVQTTTSATGKVATRLGEVATSAVAEGTIFAMPAVISGQESFVDAWTESMAMIVGFKGQHMVKSAGQVIAGMRPVANPRTMEERNKNRRGFAENLKRTMDAGANKQWNGNQPDVRFTKEELAELKQRGYGNLAALLTPTEKVLPKKKSSQPKRPKNTDGLTVYFDVGSGKKEAEADPKMKWLQQHPEFDGYATMEKLMQDPNVSQAARAKAYYMLTGRQLPMGTITGWNVGKDDKGNIWVKSVTSEGEVVTSRRFRDEASAKREEAKIIRQVELNTVDMGEQYKEMQAKAAVVETAIKAVAPNADVNEAMRVYGEVKKGNKDYDSYKDLAKSIDEAIASNPEAVERAKTLLPENIRKDIAEQTGVEVDKALGKPEAERTDAEKQAVQTYLERLYDKSASDGAATPPDAQLQGPEQFAEAYAKHRTHKGRGQVVPATMKAGDRKVYVIDGDVVQYADKSGIDVAKSDKSIVVCDAETGKYEYTSPDQLMNVGEPADPSTLSEAYMANERAKEAAANGEGTAEGNAAAESNAAANGDVSSDGGKAEVVEPAYTDGSRVEINGHEYDVKSAGEKTVVLVDEHGKELAWTRSALDAKLESGDAEVLEPKAEAAPDVATEGLKAGDVFEDSDGNALTVKRVDGDKVVAVGADGKGQTYEDGMFEQMVESGVLKRAQKTDEPSEAKVDLTDNQGNSTPQPDLYSESKGAEQSSGVQAEVPQAEVQENAPMPMRVVGKGKNAAQEEDWLATTPKRGHDYVFKESGLDAEEANAFVENKVAEAEKNLEKVKGKAPKMGTNIAAYKEAKADYEARVAEAQKAVDYWHAVKAERDKVLLEERRARKEKDKALYDDAVAQEEQRKAEMAQKAAEQEALGSNAVAPAIKEKWENAPKVDGGADEITLPNGEVVTGHYVLTESGAASASHQATNGFAETEGYPVDVNGETVNDRDYKRDTEAQQVTRGMAADYDSRALQSPVVVSGDGVVLSGNGRTMAGEIAALNGSDAKYNAYLRGHAGKFGFTAEQVEGFEHPRVVFVPDGEMPYTSETFAKFNQREQKSQSRTEMAVKLGKVVDDALFGRVMDVIGRHESLAEFYADDAATAAVVKELADAGVIPQTEMAQLFDGGRLSESGQAMVEGVLVGKVFQGSPDAVRQITEVKSMRKAVMAALPEVVACHRLGGGYDLSKELAAAVDLVYKARKAGFKLGQHVSQHARQGNLFQLDDGATVADYNNAAVMMLADVMNDGRVTQLKKVLSFYNTQAADSAQGIGDMFAGGVKSKGQIINEVNELLNNGQEYDRRTPSVADGQGVGGEGGEQGDVAGPSHQGGAGSERGLSEAFDGLAAQLKTADGEERKRVLGEMRDGIARFAEENGYPVPEFLLTREDFLAAVPEKDRAKYVEMLEKGMRMPAYYENKKVYYFVEGCNNFDKDVAETLAHEYTHADNAEFPENVNAIVYAVEDTHEVSQDELVDILEKLSDSTVYEEKAEQLEAEGKNANPMLADEVIAHSVGRMVVEGEQALDGITKNPTLQFFIKRAYKERENERQHNLYSNRNAERADKTVPSSGRNSSDNEAVAGGTPGDGQLGGSSEGDGHLEGTAERGRSTVSEGKEVAAPSLEGAKVGVTDGEKSSATGDAVPSGKGDTPLSEKIATASAEVNTEPTEAQKEAGNYKKGHVQVGTFDITIEQPQGSVRKGTDADGKQWESKMNNTYGYIRGAVGVDGDHIDVFLSNDIDGWNGRKVFVVDQYNPDGSFDEHKVMLGFNDADEAKSDYLANYENGWENGRRIDVTAVNLEDFEKWIASSKRKTKPFGEYSSVKNGAVPSGEGETDNPRQQKAVGKSAQPPTREESILRDVVIEHMKGSGLDVIGTEDGQRVLDMANDDGAKEHRVYHGSGAEFDHFDHSHMGEGEGAQAYGWGTYVTEVKGIAEGYAKRSNNGIAMGRYEWQLKRAELESNINRAKEQLPFLRGEYKAEVEAQIAEWEEQLKDYEPHNYLYTVEIPDDNGKNYLDWNAKVGVRLLNKVNRQLEQQGKRPINPELDKRYKFLDVNDLYHALSIRMAKDDATYNDDKAASEFLSSLGYAGIKYPADNLRGGRKDGAKNYVIFNENDAEITDHVRFFKTKNGEAYGFTVGGKIYYDPRIANAETPVHEYAHLWASALKANNVKEWKNVVDLMKGTNVWEEVKKTYPELETDDEIADEVLATYSGRRGAERLREEMRKAAAEGDGVMGKAEAVSALQRVKRAIDKFWKAVADFLHIHYTSAEEVADRVMKDLLDGVDPRSMMDGGKSLRPETRVNVVETKSEHGFKNYAEAKTWAKEHIARTYSGEETGGKGDIRISNAAVDKYLSQSAVDKSESKDVHLAVLKVLPDVIRESVDAEQHADFKKGEDGVRSAENGVNPNVTIHRLYGAVRMDGKLYRVKVTLKEDVKSERSAKKAYSYEATKIELLAGTLVKPEGDDPNTNNSITAAKLLNGVEKSYDGGKFFEDYNKIREQFIGEKGAAAADHADEVSVRLDNLSVAREMEAEKKDAKAIKMATGWERGADGKWRYEIADMKEFDRNGNLLYRKNHPDYARYIELQDKELKNLFEEGEELTDKEREEYEALSKKYESDTFGGEKLDNNHTLEAYVDAPELFKAYPELKNVGLRFENTGGNEIASYRYISSVFDVDKDDVGEIVVNTGKVSKNTRTREVKSAVLHEMQHAIQEIEGFAGGGSPKYMQKRFEAAKEEWRARAWADALRYKADEMGEHYNQAAVEKALIDEYKEMGMDNDEWMPDRETRMKGFNYFARGYADRSLDADIKNFRLNESTRADFSPYVEYTRLGGEVESRNVERRMGMSAEERRASLASETEDVSREDQIFLTSGDGGETAHSVEMVHKPSKEESILRDAVIEHMKGSGLDVIGTEDGQRVLDMANDDGAKEHRVYHGSGADFDHFDHSHMGEGEGAQAYGWGTYVTEVEGIGRTYAESARKKPTYLYGGKEMPSDEFHDYVLGEIGDRNENMLNDFMYNLERHGVTRAKDILKKGDLAQYKNLFYQSIGDTRNYAEGKIKAARTLLSLKGIRIRKPKSHLYAIEIPEDNGKNYLDWNSETGKDLVSRLVSILRADKELKESYEGRLSELNKELDKFAPRTLFSDTYVQLAELLGSDKKASQLLSSLGYVGIKYPADNMRGGRKDGAKNYVIFNENDAEITDHVRFFKTKNGEAYGFTVGGKIYYDPRIANAETPVHEYAHLWASALKANNVKEWKNVVDLMKGTNVWEEVKKTYPELETDDEIADEVLATYSGRRGAERLREEMRKAAAEGDGVMGKAEAVSALQRVKRAIDKFWKAVADFLHIHYTSAEEVADRVMKDLLDGVDPRKFVKKENVKEIDGIRYSLKDGSFLRSGSYFSGGGLLEEGLKDYLDPKVAVEFNEKISGVYRDNFGNHIVTADVRDVDPKKLVKDIDGPVQYFHASPVCKNFSTAKRDGGEVELDKETARSTAQFIGETRPKVVTIENVKGYKNSDALKIITDELTAQGYDWDMGVYNAADYGGYTNRERLIVRAVRDGKLPPKPEALPEGERKGGWIEAVSDLIDGLPEKKSGVPKWVDERLKGEGIDYRHIDKPLYVFGQGNSRTSIPHAFADELLPTLRTKGGDMIIMPDGRVLKVTPRVLARVTGLADDYEMPETDDLAHTVVGNGIPTQLSEHVIGPLLADVFNGGEPARKDGSAHLGRGNVAGEMGAAEDYTAFASRYGVSADMVKDYALGMKTGNLQKANFALAEIRRTMRVANRGMKLSEFGKLFRPVQKELAERYGDIEVLRQEYIDAEMRERGVMEAARKRAEEEAAERKARADELRLLPEEELDRCYFEAVERGDDAAAREMLDEAARRKGYDDTESEYQGVGAWVAPSNPGYETDEARRDAVVEDSPNLNVEDMAAGYSNQPEDIFVHPDKYSQGLSTSKESGKAIQTAIDDIRNGKKEVKIKVYRAVPTSVKESKLRNGDWVTPSKEYAEMHGNNRLEGKYRIIEDEVPAGELWWDGNDVNEWGFDDGNGYKYKNVENSRKLNDLVTRDDNGEIIAPSKRFDENVEDVRFREDNVKNPAEMSEEEKSSRGNLLLSVPAVNVESNQIVKTEEMSARRAAEKWWREHIGEPLFYDTEVGQVEINENSIGSSLAHRYGQAKLDAITSLKDGFKNAVYLGTMPDFVRQEGVQNHYFAYPIMYNGKRNYVFCRAMQDNNKNRLYVHEVFVADSIQNEGNTLQTAASQPHGGIALYKAILSDVLSAAKVGNNFETLQLSASEKAKQQAANDLARQMHVEGEVEVVTSTDGLTGRQAKAKGWYDVRTGKVTIVLPNNKNAADVRETVFHEVVAHKGLRNLVGEEHFNTFLDNVYNNAEEGIKQTIDEMAEKKYNGDKRKATEEYMAHLAEDGEYVKPENQGFFAKVRDFLTDLLRKVGIKLGFKLTDNDLRYILWRSWKGLAERDGGSVFEKAEDVKMQHELGQTDEARSASGENGIMFREGSDELKDVVEKMKADVERLHEGELDDLRSGARAIGGRLSELNKAMRLQRAYDMSTVASVTELAKTMLKNGLLSEMSDYDVRRLLSVVNNVHGKGDIRPYVQKVVDMMVGNRLRNVSKAFDKLLAMRGKKVDARGVEVQGELDLAGQRMADVVWKGIGMSDDDVADMCADAQDRMMSANGAEAAAAATDYAGWQIVMRYNETIRDSKSEEVRLREDLKRAKEDYDAGRMTREAYMEFRESTNDAIRENRIERAEAYEDLYEQLGGAYGESIKRAADFKAAEKARVLEIQHNANSDMEGRPARSYRKDTAVDKVLNSSPVQLLFAPLGTFDQMLRMFGSKNVKGEGYLWNRYMRGWLTATENEYTGYRDATAELDAKAAEVLGKGKTWADLFALERKLPKATVRVWDNGEMRELELPQGNLLYIYMVDKMADGRMKLRKMGVTEDDVAAIEDFLDPRLKEIGDWLQEVYLVEKRGKYNEVHERMFGAAMASIDNYFPLKILKDARAENVDVGVEKRESEMASTITGSVVKRTRNALALDLLNSDAFSVVLDHLQQMEHWSAFAEWNRDLNTLLSYKHFRNQVKNMRSAYGSGERLWEAFDKVARIAAGTYTPPKAFADKLAVNIAKGVTAAKICLRVFTALKQFTSFPAYLSDSNPVYLLKGVANPYGSWKWCMENLPLFEKRWKSRMAGDPRLLKNEMDWGLWRDNVVQMAAKWGMTPNGFVDALTVCIGARAMYETRRRKYIRYGYGLEEAERRAKQDASILYNQTQQSSEGAFLSALQVDRSWYSVLFTVFRNSSMSYTRQLYAALRNTGRRIAGGAKFKGISEAFMAKQMERDGIDPEKASKNAKAEYRKSWINDFVRAGVFGYVLQLAWNCGPYALYMLFGDDEKKGKEMWHDIWTHTAFGSVEGLTGGDVWSAGLQSLWNHYVNGEDFNANSVNKDMPLTSDLLKVVKKVGSDNYGAVNDVLNLLVQAGFGVNPQTLTDAAVAIYDYCGSDVETTKECALLVMRVMNCPQSQMDNIYFDEIDATGEEAKAMSVEEIAERYARYKALRSAPLRALSSDALKAAEKKPRERVLTEAKEQLDGRLMTEEAQRYLDEYEATKKKVTETRALADTDPKAFMQQMPALARSGEFRRYRRVGLYKSEVDKLTKKLLRTSDPAERRALFGKMLDARDKMLKQVKEME
jgi:site-specific DNA-cytosine methylase